LQVESKSRHEAERDVWRRTFVLINLCFLLILYNLTIPVALCGAPPPLPHGCVCVCVQQFGFDDQFGANDQIGAKNQFGRGALFGDKIMFGKNQEFGPRNTFASPEYLVGGDEYGSRNWGLQARDIPAKDKSDWEYNFARYPDYIPEREARKRVLTLHQNAEAKLLKKAAAIQVERVAKKADAIAAIERAASLAAAETKRLQNVAHKLQQIKV